MKHDAKKYTEHIKLKWFHRFKILKPKIKRVKTKTDYVKYDIKNNRKTKRKFILLLLIFFIGATSIAGVTVYATVGIKHQEIKIVDLVDLESRVTRFNNQSYAYSKNFEAAFEQEFENDESIKEMQLKVIDNPTMKTESEIIAINYQAKFTLNKNYKWSDNTKQSKTFDIAILLDSKLIIDSEQILKEIKTNLGDRYFESTEDVIKEVSLFVPITGVVIKTITYDEPTEIIEIEIVKEKNYFWLDEYSSDSRNLSLKKSEDFMLITFVDFEVIKKQIENNVKEFNLESPIKDAQDLESRLNTGKEIPAIKSLTVEDVGSDNNEFYFRLKIILKDNYKFANEISNNTFDMIVKRK